MSKKYLVASLIAISISSVGFCQEPEGEPSAPPVVASDEAPAVAPAVDPAPAVTKEETPAPPPTTSPVVDPAPVVATEPPPAAAPAKGDHGGAPATTAAPEATTPAAPEARPAAAIKLPIVEFRYTNVYKQVVTATSPEDIKKHLTDRLRDTRRGSDADSIEQIQNILGDYSKDGHEISDRYAHSNVIKYVRDSACSDGTMSGDELVDELLRLAPAPGGSLKLIVNIDGSKELPNRRGHSITFGIEVLDKDGKMVPHAKYDNLITMDSKSLSEASQSETQYDWAKVMKGEIPSISNRIYQTAVSKAIEGLYSAQKLNSGLWKEHQASCSKAEQEAASAK